jgi:protein TorT
MFVKLTVLLLTQKTRPREIFIVLYTEAHLGNHNMKQSYKVKLYSLHRLFWLRLYLLLIATLPLSLCANTVTLESWLQPFQSNSPKRTIDYQWETSPTQGLHVCAIIPSSHTSYWFAINYGLVKKSREMAIALQVFNINDDASTSEKNEVFDKCAKHQPQSIIIGIDLDSNFESAIFEHLGIGSVITVGKNLHNKSINASTSASYSDIGKQLSHYLNKRSDTTAIDLAVLFPGDKSAQHVNLFVKALTPGINKNKYKIKDIIYTTDSYLEIKSELTRYLNNNLNITTIVASALVAQAAVEVLDEMSLSGDIRIISYELSAQIYRELKRGNIQASITTPPVIQGLLAVDMAIKLLDNPLNNIHISPKALLLDSDNIRNFDISPIFAPYGYRETLEVN